MKTIRLHVINFMLIITIISTLLPMNASITVANEVLEIAAYTSETSDTSEIPEILGIPDTTKPSESTDTVNPYSTPASVQGADPSSAEVLKAMNFDVSVPGDINRKDDPLGAPDDYGNVKVQRYNELALSFKSGNSHSEELYSASLGTPDTTQKAGLGNNSGNPLLSPNEKTTLYSSSAESSYMFENAVGADFVGYGIKEFTASIRVNNNQLVLQIRSNMKNVGVQINLGVRNGFHYDNLKDWERMAFLPIAVVDFNGDHTDEIAVCYPEGSNDGDKPKNNNMVVEIFKVDFNRDKKTLSISSLNKFYLNDMGANAKDLYIHRNYDKIVIGSRHRNDIDRAPLVHLQAGDVQGQGKASLIITAAFGGVDHDGDNGRDNIAENSINTLENRATRVFILDKPLESTVNTFFNMKWYSQPYSYTGDAKITITNSKEIMRNAATAVGDVNGDGLNEIVLAGTRVHMDYGYTSLLLIKSYFSHINVKENFITTIRYKDGKYVMATDSSAKDLKIPPYLPAVKVQQDVLNGYYSSDCPIIEPVALTCYKAAGDMEPAYIFLEGSILKLVDTAGGETVAFDKIRDISFSYTSNEKYAWISKAVAGNFDKNPGGKEQVIFSYCQRKNVNVGATDYTWCLQKINDTKLVVCKA